MRGVTLLSSRSVALVLALAPLVETPAAVPPPDPPAPLESLKTVQPPEPNNLGDFVQNRSAAILLGKALFWDMQVGSDGVQACASCHFHSGADNRRKNQLNPALLAGDTTFQVGGPNYTVRPRDFPITANDVMSSQGVFNTFFADVAPPAAADLCNDVRDPVFHVNGFNTRRVEPRNAPVMVNAVFNFRNFWDGRANNNFNGQSVFGQRDPNAKVFKADVSGNLQAVSVTIPLSSLASQAVGPPVSDFEMSCADRIWAEIGEKLFDPRVIPLVKQRVHPRDSVLGPRARPSTGINITYAELVRQAFRSEWWSSSQTVTIRGEPYTQMEANAALFFGLAVQLYEATLIADDTRFDRFLEGRTTALTDFEKQGLAIFQNQGRCQNCHGGAELTNASVRNVLNERLERMIMGDGGCAIYDNGFYNIGVRPTAEDLGVGGTDPFGNPLSETRMAMQGKFFDDKLDPPLGAVPECDNRANVDGAFKTPGLRGVELSGPYFHNGGKGTLRQVVEFYNRGGDFAAQNIANLDPDIAPIGLTDTEISSVVAFLQALTDERVRQDQAPFDHPQLFRPQGHPGDDKNVAPGVGIKAADDLFEVPAIGAGGRPELGLTPLQPFLTVAKMTGSGTLGSGRQEAIFDLDFEVVDDNAGTAKMRLRVREDIRRFRMRSDLVDRYFTTETCLEASGPAEVNGSTGFRYDLKTCDNGQPGNKEGDGRSADTFQIRVTGSSGVVFDRSGSISGGNVQAFIR
jgi:cytochrome c peroxidase